jgi:hypothetical protein
MAGAMGFFNYVSDDGNTYKVKLDARNSAAVGAAASSNNVWYPKGWVTRYILASNATYGRRRVPAPDPTDDTWTGVTNSLALQVAGVATSPTFDITARIGEKRTSRG